MKSRSNPINAINSIVSAVNAPNQFVQTNGRRLAYRSIGTGEPIVLCTRFHGNIDVWDPAFLDVLKDAKDLIEALDLNGVVISGWSLGGMVA